MWNFILHFSIISLILCSLVTWSSMSKAEQLPLDIKQPYQIKSEEHHNQRAKEQTENKKCVIKTVMTDSEIQACRT